MFLLPPIVLRRMSVVYSRCFLGSRSATGLLPERLRMSGLFPLHFPLSLFYPAINVKQFSANDFEREHFASSSKKSWAFESWG